MNGLVSKRAGSTSTFYTYDPQGSVSARLNDQGALVSSDLYDAYGQLRAGNPNSDSVGYCGQWGYYTDHSMGYILCTYRWYDPLTARWLTRDPIGYSGGLNLYGYVGGNPVNWVDPLGWLGVPKAPPGVDIHKNGREAAEHPFNFLCPIASSAWLKAQVRGNSHKGADDHGPWDFKDKFPKNRAPYKDFEDFGNYHYGYVCAAAGIPRKLAGVAAGRAQRAHGGPRQPGFSPTPVLYMIGIFPYGDEEKDERYIDLGYDNYAKYGKPNSGLPPNFGYQYSGPGKFYP